METDTDVAVVEVVDVDWKEACEGVTGDDGEYGKMNDEDLEDDSELDPDLDDEPDFGTDSRGPNEEADEAGVGGPIIKFNIPRFECATIFSSMRVIV